MVFLPTRENYISKKIQPVGRSWGLTKNIPFPNKYVDMLPEYKGWIFLEEEALTLRGKWATVFEKPEQPLDLELGCGNGFFFSQQVEKNPNRNLLGIELKYKPLVQTVRRVKTKALENGRGIRFHAGYIDGLFAPEELHNIYIYFPDPWPKKRQQKNRLINQGFLKLLKGLQKQNHFVDIKTDSEDYFNSIEKEIVGSGYTVSRVSRDLHKSQWAQDNFQTSFERIFVKKGQPIFYVRLTNTPS